jgi:site-specific DNA recombinase
MRYFQYIRKSTDDGDHQALSLEKQERENLRRFGDDPEVVIVETIEEKRSAKVPGRPLFNQMLNRIERGEADAILAWQPNRLARNSIDGGRVIYLVDTGKLKDLKFANYTFENNPQGKFMLSIAFANAKYDVDALSSNVKGGNRTKRENGWLPNMAPSGYLNVDRKGPTPIIADPERFPLVKRLWEYALTGVYTVPQLLDMATNEWGLRTKKRKKIGGKPLSFSGIYQLFKNPFYAGIIRHEGIDYPGKHPAMITMADFLAVQRILGRADAPRPVRHQWDYTGLLKCVCGRSVTAEAKTNRFGSKYVYYHCSRRRTGNVCPEPYVEVRDLEVQMREFIESVTLSPKRHAWALRLGQKTAAEAGETIAVQRAALGRARAEAETALRNLRHMRSHEQITEAEFLADRQELSQELSSVMQELDRLSPEEVIEPEQGVVLLNVCALKWF